MSGAVNPSTADPRGPVVEPALAASAPGTGASTAGETGTAPIGQAPPTRRPDPPAERAPPRVLVLTRDDPARSTGGVETFCRLLLRVFPGSDVLAYSRAAGRRLVLNELRDAAAILPRLDARIAELRPAVVVANGAAAWAISSGRAHPLVPVITTYHGTYAGFGRAIAPVAWRRGLIARTYGAFLERRAGRGRAATVAVSAPVAAEAELFYGAAPRVLENCAVLDGEALPARDAARARLGVATGAKAVLFVGRPDPTKGFALVHALAAARPELVVLAAGATADPRFPPNLRALGVLDSARLADAYAAVDAVVHPSYYEGCPFALLDSIAADRPIVTTATGCFPTAGLHPFGIVLAAVEPAAFVGAVLAVLQERERFAPRAACAARFSFARFAREWRALVADVVTDAEANRGR